jgi:hypothetical protein
MLECESKACPPRTEVLIDIDQRKHHRYLFLDGSVMRLSIRPEFRGRRGILLDISTGGIGFLLQEALDAGTVLAFEVENSTGGDSIGRLARVRHCRPHPTPPNAPWLPPASPTVSRIFRSVLGVKNPPPPVASWLVGCEFDRPLEENEIRAFIDNLRNVGDEAE